MKQKDKDLLLKDLCGRLPYGVKVKMEYYDDAWNICSINPNGVTFVTKYTGYPIETNWENCKPYLFPLSSMTEEQRLKCFNGTPLEIDKYGDIAVKDCICGNSQYTDLEIYLEVIDWLNKNHFDYRNLISKGLAIDATGLNIY